MNNKKIIIGILSVLILLFAFFTIRNIRDNKARSSEVDFVQQMKIQQNELTQKLQLLEDSLQQFQSRNSNSNRLVVLEKELASLELQKQSGNIEVDKKIENIKKEIATLKQSAKKLNSLKKELTNLEKQKKKGVKNDVLDKKINNKKKEIADIEQSSKRVAQLQKELSTLEQQKKSTNNVELDKKIENVKQEIAILKKSSITTGSNEYNVKSALREKELEVEIKRLETLQKQSNNSSQTLSKNQEVAKLQKQIEVLTNQQKNSAQSTQDREEIARLKKQLTEVNARSKNATAVDQGDYAMQIELLKKQLIECKKSGGGTSASNSRGGNIDANKEDAYKKQISDLQQQLAQYNQALSTRAKEVSDNIKMLAQNIQATGLYIDKKSNVEKSTLYVAKMQTFKVSFTITSTTPMEGDLTLVVRIYNMSTDEVLKIPGIPYVQISKQDGNEITCSYAEMKTTRSEKKLSFQKVFDASEFIQLTKNAFFMIEIYSRKGVLLGTEKVKIFSGEPVTTF